MKIERNAKVSILFKDLKKGDVFIDREGDVCMKIERLFVDSISQNVNAITLDFGDLFYIEDDSFVWLPRSAKLVVEE